MVLHYTLFCSFIYQLSDKKWGNSGTELAVLKMRYLGILLMSIENNPNVFYLSCRILKLYEQSIYDNSCDDFLELLKII